MAADGPFTASAGSLVALEGLADDALESQLRLLPSSSQILVLPSLQHYLDQDSDTASDNDNDDALRQGPHSAAVSAVQPYSTPYDVRRYIRRVHAAASARRDVALEFLRGGNDSQDQFQSQSQSRSQSKSHSNYKSRPQKQYTSKPETAQRIVFLHGGTASSHALCIEAIRHASANECVDKAARLFYDLTSDGVAGLYGAPPTSLRAAAPSRARDLFGSNNISNDCTLPTDSDDPITKAMRAADALDRETETLQPNTNTIDLTTDGGTPRRMRPRSMSLPAHDELLDLVEFSRRMSHARKASVSAASGISTAMTASTATPDRASSIWARPSIAAGTSGSEAYDMSNYNFMSPSFAHGMDSPSSIPSFAPSFTPSFTPSHLQLLTRFSMTTQTTTHSPTRSPTRSPTSTIFPISMRLDAIASQSQRGRSRFRPRNLAAEVSAPSVEDRVPPMPPRRALSLERSRSRSFASNFLLSSSRDTSRQRLSYLSDMTQSTTSATPPPMPMPRNARISFYDTASIQDFPVRARPFPTPLGSKPNESQHNTTHNLHSRKRPPLYVDRGTDAEIVRDGAAQLQPPLPSGDNTAFEPVLPLTEDLVVYFDDGGGSANQALGLAFQHCQELYCSRVRRQRRNQKQQQQLLRVHANDLDRHTIASSLPETPRSASHGSHVHTSSVSTTASSTGDYDPFAPHAYDTNTSPRSRPHAPSLSSVNTAKPPTPAHTPPPTNEGDGAGSDDDDISSRVHTSPHFHILDASTHQTPLALQNALRAVLAGHFSAPASDTANDDDDDDTENDGLAASPGRSLMSYLTCMQSPQLWTPLLDGVDLVLALGGQRGVQSELMAKITSQLDHALGPDGAARCDRLDVRYLMANAMQSMTSFDRSAHNDSTALAALVLKQLDLYLRTSPAGADCAFSSPRTVLLDYPFELLAIVLALRQLAGRDVAQVASVVVMAADGDADKDTDELTSRPGFQKQRASPPPCLRSIPSSHSVRSMASNNTSTADRARAPYLRANYLLTSTASSVDIAAFVAAVRRIPVLASLPPVQPRETAERYSALSTATTAAGMSMCRHSNMSPMYSPAAASRLPMPKSMPMSPVAARKPTNAHERTASSTTTIRHAPAPAPAASPASSVKSLASPMSRVSHVSQASQSSSIVSQPDSWRSTTGSNYKIAATGLAPAPVVLPSSRLVAKTIQVGRRRDDIVPQVLVQPQVQMQAQRQPSPQPSPQPRQLTPELKYNDDDYDFEGLDDDDLDNDADMRRLMPLYMRDRTLLLKAKEAAGVRNVRVPLARSQSGRLTESGVMSRRSMLEYQSQGLNQSTSPCQVQTPSTVSHARSLQARGSMNSLRSHVSLGQNNEGQKALKWLGLA